MISSCFDVVTVLNVPFCATTNEAFLSQLSQDITHHKNRMIVTANPEIVLAANQTPNLMSAINAADYVVADGIGVVMGAKMLKTPLPERITGFDTLEALLKLADEKQLKVALIGAKPHVIKKAQANIAQKYPNADIVLACDGYFDEAGEQKIAQKIAQTKPQLVFVALGAVLQETFIRRHFAATNAIWMGVGGSFDVLAGQVKRAPKKWQELHLEWLYRILADPKRFKRSFAIPKFIFQIFIAKLRQ